LLDLLSDYQVHGVSTRNDKTLYIGTLHTSIPATSHFVMMPHGYQISEEGFVEICDVVTKKLSS